MRKCVDFVPKTRALQLVSYMPLANFGREIAAEEFEPGAPTAAQTTCFYLAPSVRSSIRRSICLARLAPSEIQAARRISSKLCRRKAAKRHRRDPKLPPPPRTAKRHRRQRPWPSSRSTSARCRSSSSTPTRASSRTRSSNYLCGNQPVRHLHGRAVRNRYRHAIEQASRRWRGGRRDDSARTRRKI